MSLKSRGGTAEQLVQENAQMVQYLKEQKALVEGDKRLKVWRMHIQKIVQIYQTNDFKTAYKLINHITQVQGQAPIVT